MAFGAVEIVESVLRWTIEDRSIERESVEFVLPGIAEIGLTVDCLFSWDDRGERGLIRWSRDGKKIVRGVSIRSIVLTVGRWRSVARVGRVIIAW